MRLFLSTVRWSRIPYISFIAETNRFGPFCRHYNSRLQRSSRRTTSYQRSKGLSRTIFCDFQRNHFPHCFSTFPIIRNILLREQIQIVHSHGSASTFAHEGILHANTMGLRTVFTDHSLYGFNNLTSIWVNKLLTFTLTNIDRVICVSNTCKENMIVRTELSPDIISVIPNAVVSEDFKPRDPTGGTKRKQSRDKIVIVVIGRLFQTKGPIYLLA